MFAWSCTWLQYITVQYIIVTYIFQATHQRNMRQMLRFFLLKHWRLMGVNKRIVPRLDLQAEFLPQPFVASRDIEILKKNYKVALDILGVSTGRRNYCLVMDETVWHATFDVISGLRSSLGYVGGMYHTDPEQDKSFLDVKQMRETPETKLARLTQHYIVSKCDTNGQTFCINILPRPQKAAEVDEIGADWVFQELGQMLEAACQSNNDMPPISLGYDAATNHSTVNRAFAGLVGASAMKNVPFFKLCEVKPVKLHCFRFGILMYKGKLATLGVLDLNHVCKRYAFHICSSARSVMFGDFCVELAMLIQGGLGCRAYASVDIQSDKAYAQKLNPGYLRGLRAAMQKLTFIYSMLTSYNYRTVYIIIQCDATWWTWHKHAVLATKWT